MFSIINKKQNSGDRRQCLQKLFALARNDNQRQSITIPVALMNRFFKIGNPSYKPSCNISSHARIILYADLDFTTDHDYKGFEFHTWESNSGDRLDVPGVESIYAGMPKGDDKTYLMSALVATGFRAKGEVAEFAIGVQKKLNGMEELRDPLAFGVKGRLNLSDGTITIDRLMLPVFDGDVYKGLKRIPPTDENIIRGLYFGARCAKHIFEGYKNVPVAFIYREVGKMPLDAMAKELGIQPPQERAEPRQAELAP